MAKENLKSKAEHRPILVITLSLILGIIGVGVYGGLAWRFSVGYKIFQVKEHQLVKNVGTIMRLDEVLTMSCKMAAATGEARYDQRYHQFAPELDRTIKETMELFPQAKVRVFASKTDEANQRLVEMEGQAFALVREGQLAKAMAIPNSEKYLKWKERYKEGMTRISDVIFREAQNYDRKFLDYQKGLIVSGILGVVFVFGWWGYSILMAVRLDRTAQALQASDQTKSIFIGKMSHELRTPLNSVIGFSEVLRDETFGPLNEKQKSCVDDVLTSGEHLLLIVDNILDFTKNEFKEADLSLTLISCKELLQGMLAAFQKQSAYQGLEMTLRGAENVGKIMADKRRIKQILSNLLSNAIKFTPRGGKIRVVVSRRGTEVLFEVQDTGAGIARKDQKDVFKGFTQIEGEDKRQHDGIGLGLVVAGKLVELHGGKIWVESEGSGQGTTVRFTIPLRGV
jgi:signal transduction histidine kinase